MKRGDFLGLQIGATGALLFVVGALLGLLVHKVLGFLVALLGFLVAVVGFVVHASRVFERMGRRWKGPP